MIDKKYFVCKHEKKVVGWDSEVTCLNTSSLLVTIEQHYYGRNTNQVCFDLTDRYIHAS